MRGRIQALKENLAAVFDDNLHTKRWHNIADWLIISLIILSTLEIFLSTFDIDPALRRVLLWVDAGILIFFTIEVTLRIWVAPLVDSKYRGWKGRLRYCFSFHGFIDIISTYPFYLQWLIPFPVAWLRTFRMSRTVRLFRVSRYMKSWRLLEEAIISKKRELLISMQFLLIVTLILSLLLYFCEHEAQPEVYDTGLSSVLWAFGQYIGDPGGFAENPPITGLGKTIACIVGLLGIAIVAVPAGILGSGFTETIENVNKKEILEANREKLNRLFERQLDRPTGFQAVNFFKSMADVQARTGLNEHDILDVVNETRGYRIINLASTIPVEKMPLDRIAIEHFPINRPYGVCIDRNSQVTIVAMSSLVDAAGGLFAFYLALIGGFNFLSREMGQTLPYKTLFQKKDDMAYSPDELMLYDDLKAMINKHPSWVFDILPSSGANENEYDTEFHFGIGNPKGNDSFAGKSLLVKDLDRYKEFYEAVSLTLKDDFSILCDNGKYHSTSSSDIWHRKLGLRDDVNSVVLRTAWSAILWNDKRLLIAKKLAECINRYILGKDHVDLPESLTKKDIGFNGYDI